MFQADNIINLPNDIHGMIFDKLNNGNDMHNFKNTCKIFNNYVNNENKLNVNLFKISYVFEFKNCDINKHASLCKKFTKIISNFNIVKIHFNRTHSFMSIFDTKTVIYITLFTDNIKESKYNLLKLLKENNIKNYSIMFNIMIYFNDYFIDNVITNFNKNNNDIIISNISLQKIENDHDFDKFEKYLKDNMYEYFLSKNSLQFEIYNNIKLYINKIALLRFIKKLIHNITKNIDELIFMMNSTYDINLIKNYMHKLDNNVNKLNKYKKYRTEIETNILKNEFKNRVIRKLDMDFELVND